MKFLRSLKNPDHECISPLKDRYAHWINRRKFQKFKDYHQGERCFIIGNGPSLSPNDLEKLKKEVTFAANKIYMIFPKTGWRPKYYVVEDDHMIQQHHGEIRQLKSIMKFVNSNWKHLFRGVRNVIAYPWHFLEEPSFPKFSENSLEIVYCGYMVTYISLQLAFFMGFTRVYLLGVDFNYSLIHQNGPSFEHAPHHPSNHFTPDYFKPGETRYLPQLNCAERAMRCAKELYEAHGRKIWNATRGGKLEVFDRISLEEAIEK